MPETSSRNDPFAAFNFILEIDEVPVAGFSECTGLNTETDVIEYRNGDEQPTMRKLPGLKKFGNITLKRGLGGREMWDWRKTVLDGETVRRSGSIVLLDEARNVAIRWTFREAWPRKWEGPALNAKTNEVAIETVEIAHEGLEWDE